VDVDVDVMVQVLVHLLFDHAAAADPESPKYLCKYPNQCIGIPHTVSFVGIGYVVPRNGLET
jgi:hypothetical protein